jgi:hypothetical protein
MRPWLPRLATKFRSEFARSFDDATACSHTYVLAAFQLGAFAKRVTVFFRNWVQTEQNGPNIGIRCAR